MTYDPRPTFNRWANQYVAKVIPIFMNTSDAGEGRDYAPVDLTEVSRTAECVNCGRACPDCAEEEEDGQGN